MNNKLLTILYLLSGMACFGQIQIDTNSTDATTGASLPTGSTGEEIHPAKMELAMHFHQNTKYKLVGHGIRFYSPRFWNSRFRIRFDNEGYRSFVPFKDGVFPGAAEFNKFNLDIDYYKRLADVGQGFFYWMPHLGPSLSLDVSKYNKNGGNIFGMNPRIGADIGLEYGRFRLLVQSNFTFYLDGLWMEFQPIMNFRVFKRIYLKIALNLVEAVTYSGNNEFGFYPGGGISWHPRGLGKNRRE
jgi:hypothetical protein